MEIEKQVASRELSEKLKELGFPQNSYFQWVELMHHEWPNGNKTGWLSDMGIITKWELWDETQKSDYETGIEFQWIAAPTASELGEWLSSNIEQYDLIILKFSKTWVVKYQETSANEIFETLVWEHDENLANAIAKMLIWLVENGYVKF